MRKNPIVIIADRDDRVTYDLLITPDEIVCFHLRHEISAILRCRCVDMYLLDCGDQVEWGISALNNIKRSQNNVPVIFLTCQRSEDVVLAAFRAGAREYFWKPVNLAELAKTMEYLLNLKRCGSHAGPLFEVPGVMEKVPDKIKRALHFMEGHLAESLDLDRLAREACLSKYHFSRTFKQLVGETPMHHVSRQRIEWAKVLLRDVNLNVSTVACTVGCCHFGNFTRQFKRMTGMTPAEYKKSLVPGSPHASSSGFR